MYSSNPVDNWTNYDPIAFPGDLRQFHKPPAFFQDVGAVTDTNVIVLLEAKTNQTKKHTSDGDEHIEVVYSTSIVHLKKELAKDRSNFRNKVGFISDPQSKYLKCTKCSLPFDDKTKLKYQCKFCKDVICGSCSLGVLESQYELEQFETHGYRVCKPCGPHPSLQEHLAEEQEKLNKDLNAAKSFEEREAAAKAERIKDAQAKYDATMQCFSHPTFRRPPSKNSHIVLIIYR